MFNDSLIYRSDCPKWVTETDAADKPDRGLIKTPISPISPIGPIGPIKSIKRVCRTGVSRGKRKGCPKCPESVGALVEIVFKSRHIKRTSL